MDASDHIVKRKLREDFFRTFGVDGRLPELDALADDQLSLILFLRLLDLVHDLGNIFGREESDRVAGRIKFKMIGDDDLLKPFGDRGLTKFVDRHLTVRRMVAMDMIIGTVSFAHNRLSPF